MIEYRGRKIPDDQAAFTELLRKEAHRSVPWDDAADRPPGALDWVRGLAALYPELRERIESAYASLLADADPVEVRGVLEQAVEHGDPERFAQLLSDAVAQHAEQLRTKDDTTRDDRSLLGAVVAQLADLGRPNTITVDAAHVLAEIDERRDGWPTSFRVALSADPETNLGRLVDVLGALDADDLEGFVADLLNLEPALGNRAFDAIGSRAAADVRRRVAQAAKDFLARAESSRQLLVSSGVLEKYPADVRAKMAVPRADRWPSIAERLRVDT